MTYHPDGSALLAAVIKAAKPIIRDFRVPQHRRLKADGSPVTATDLAVHEALLAWSVEQGLGYIGEEGNGTTSKDYILYVDPLDGTSSFSAGIATVTVAASIMKRFNESYRPILSVIYEPLTSYSWIGRPDGTAWLNDGPEGVKLHVDPSPTQALITTIFPPGPLRELRRVRDRINGNQPHMKHQSCGSLALCGGLIASGMTHGLIFGGGSAAEVCAMIPILEGAGATVSDLEGEPLEGFELGDHKGKVDFVLPNGFIAASDSELWRTLYTLVEEERAGV